MDTDSSNMTLASNNDPTSTFDSELTSEFAFIVMDDEATVCGASVEVADSAYCSEDLSPVRQPVQMCQSIEPPAAKDEPFDRAELAKLHGPKMPAAKVPEDQQSLKVFVEDEEVPTRNILESEQQNCLRLRLFKERKRREQRLASRGSNGPDFWTQVRYRKNTRISKGQAVKGLMHWFGHRSTNKTIKEHLERVLDSDSRGAAPEHWASSYRTGLQRAM